MPTEKNTYRFSEPAAINQEMASTRAKAEEFTGWIRDNKLGTCYLAPLAIRVADCL